MRTEDQIRADLIAALDADDDERIFALRDELRQLRDTLDQRPMPEVSAQAVSAATQPAQPDARDQWAIAQTSGDQDLEESLLDAAYRVHRLPDVIELVRSGNWLWLKGHTYAIRDQLKAAGFYWHKDKTRAINPSMNQTGLAVWYWSPTPIGKGKRRYRSNTPEAIIRAKYGAEEV